MTVDGILSQILVMRQYQMLAGLDPELSPAFTWSVFSDAKTLQLDLVSKYRTEVRRWRDIHK